MSSTEDSDADILMGNSITGLLDGVTQRSSWNGSKTTWEPPSEEELKRLFPAYQIECLLGRGGMGIVYKARDTVMRKTVAIKLLPPLLAEDAQLMARFKREAQIMNSLDHPGIVKVDSFVQTPDGHAYFVMDYVEGKTIHELVQAKEITVRKTLRLVVQVCKALHYLHGQGILHRDIKPSNIIVDGHGNARLLDFGIAGQAEKGAESLTLTGHNPGTPFYMAPELHKGDPPTTSSDIYALGVTFYEMLTGERPQIQAPPPSKRSKADPGVDKVVFRALKTQPAARYQNADDMRRDLQRCSRASREFRQGILLATPIIVIAALGMVWLLRPEDTGKSPVSPMVVETMFEPLHDQPGEKTPEPAIDPAPEGQGSSRTLDSSSAENATPFADFNANVAGSISELKFPGGKIMKFIYCPAGTFFMGSPPTEKNRSPSEDQVLVNLSQGFWMAQTECTQGQWKAIMGENPRQLMGDDFPVTDMSWLDSQTFITKMASSSLVPTGWKASLPTAAQWEYACRAGTSTTFHFGDTLNGTQANCVGSSPYGTYEKGPSLGKRTLVGSYPPNAWGLYDMHGNVREWTADWFGGKLEGGTDPQGQPTGEVHSFRGGAWGDDAWRCRAARSARCFGPGDDTRGTWYGFRIALIPSHADTSTKLTPSDPTQSTQNSAEKHATYEISPTPEIGILQPGVNQFSNRNYKWGKISQDITNWEFTRSSIRQEITVKVKRKGWLFLVTKIESEELRLPTMEQCESLGWNNADLGDAEEPDGIVKWIILKKFLDPGFHKIPVWNQGVGTILIHPDLHAMLGEKQTDFIVPAFSTVATSIPSLQKSTSQEAPTLETNQNSTLPTPLTEFTATLRGHGWSYEDSLYPGSNEQPPSPMIFHPNGKFHERWKWNYWIPEPGILHVQFWDPVYKPETAVVLNFNEARTAYSGQFKDEKGRLHKLSGTRLDPIK